MSGVSGRAWQGTHPDGVKRLLRDRVDTNHVLCQILHSHVDVYGPITCQNTSAFVRFALQETSRPIFPCKSPCQNLPRSFRGCSIHYAARVALISSACWKGYSIARCMGSPLRSTVVALQISISRFGPAYHEHANRTETVPGKTQLGI